MEKVKTFFWYCSGADASLLKECPSESSKYVGIGATIFFTGLFAALSGGYALYTVFDNAWLAIPLGLTWGLMIFNLDRYIVSSMRKTGKPFNELGMALPRIILALLISIVIAKPLELKIFEKEINGELTVMEQELYARQEQEVRDRYTGSRASAMEEVERLQQQVADKTAQRDDLARIAREEADGTGGTGLRNAGPIYRIKKADADRVEAELEELKTSQEKLVRDNLAQVARLDSLAAYDLATLEKEKIDGPAARIDALNRLAQSSNPIWWANAFIILLFIAIETAPIFVKLIANQGPYDHLLATAEYRFETSALENKAHIHTEIKKRSEELSPVEKTYVTETLDMKLDST